jgi:D-alanyl-D-alanine carboxypeptidase
MTKTVTNDTAREHCRPAMLAAAATATMMILTGCSSSSSTAPTSAPATTPATSTNPAASLDAEKTKVIAAYDAYLQATVRLYAGG